MDGTRLVVMGAMVLVNAVFAAYEIALASVTVARLQVLATERRRGAAAALRMKAGMEASLAMIQLGITLVGTIAAAIGGAGAEESIAPSMQEMGLPPAWAESLAIAIVVIPLTAATIVIGELVPKLFALRNKEWVCLQLSPPMSWFAFSIRPAIWVLESLAKVGVNWIDHWHRQRRVAEEEVEELQELRAIASLARTARLIGAREEKIILGAARLSSRPVSEIMLPAEHISMLCIQDSIADCLIAAHLDMHTRFPLAERAGDPQAIIGYVNFKDIVAHMRLSPHEASLRGIVRSITSVPANLPISSTLESLMRQHTHIALVRDDTGLVVGMVTLEDIIEELVGDIQDEYDLLPVHAVASGTGWVAGGGISLARLQEITGIDLNAFPPANGAHHLSGWVAGHIGQIVRGGEVVVRGGVRVVVRKVRREQVLEAQVSLVKATTAAPQPPEKGSEPDRPMA